MAGTKLGGQRAAQTNIEKYGPSFYKNIGSIGGKKGRTGGFASNEKDENGMTGRDRARVYGAKGGRISRRRNTKAQ